MVRKRAEACFMSRLRRDTRGNVLAISAAALLPLAGLIGGGVDMSRLYLTKTRLQQACDAGALAGRKAMAAGSWTTGEGDTSETRAKQFFAANFLDGAYGSKDLAYTFIEVDGEVRGSAYVTVPMTMMRIFNMQERDMEVTCTAKMEIPNTDVMFVLDITGSMNCPAGSTSCSNNGNVEASNARIKGLRSAVKCFYEALVRVNTAQVCTTSDPTATAYNGTAQIRLGFVPYGVNVNVGRLLHNDWIADTWTFQSRVANVETVYSWSVGTATTPQWGDWTPSSSLGTGFTRTTGYNSFGIVPASSYTLETGITYQRRHPTATSQNCSSLNQFGGRTELLGITQNDPTPTSAPTYTGNAPVYPASDQAVLARQTRTVTVDRGYRYRWFSSSGTSACWLEWATKKSSQNYEQQRTGAASRPVTWTEHQHVASFDYGPRPIDISGLKSGGSNWAAEVVIPNMDFVSGDNVTLSGSNSATRIRTPVDATVRWDGCIEERHTYQNTNRNPAGDWSSIPAEALDMDIDLVPSASTALNSHWGPLLENATHDRYSSGSTRTVNPRLGVTQPFNRDFAYYCNPNNAARKLKEYKTSSEVSDFQSYINNLVTKDTGTYHDTGMLWGARLLSPTGIFASENQESSSGGNIQRHLIFMTDGNAQAFTDNYGMFGIPIYSRRQTDYDPTTSHLVALTNARLVAMCGEIKRRNIRLWVVSYGGGVSSTDEARLSTCASASSFFTAADDAALLARFQQIAAEIADLRLTN